MITNVRSKVASRISKIKEADDFNFSSWLKKPLQQDHPIEEISSYVRELDGEQDNSRIQFVPVNFSQYEFGMTEPNVTDELKNCEFPKVKSNTVFFMIALPMEKSIVYSDVKLKHKSYPDKKIEFELQNPEIKKIQAAVEATNLKKLDFLIEVPANQNYLSNLVPEVFKIDLLEFEDLVSSAKKVKVQSIKFDKFKKAKVDKLSVPNIPEIKKIFRIKVPEMGKYKLSEREVPISLFSKPTISETVAFQVQKVMTWYANFEIATSNTLLYYRPSKENNLTTEDKILDEQLRELLGIVLSHKSKLNWESSGHHLIKLKPHEEDAVKFLVETDYALLQDEFGIDIQKETISALNLLFNNKVIKMALIVTNEPTIGHPQLLNNSKMEYDWSKRIRKYCPELSYNIISGNNNERADLWTKWKQVTIANMDTVLNDYRLKILEGKNLDNFDCIILESVDQLLDLIKGREDFFSAMQPRILWATSNVLDKNLLRELNAHLNSAVQIERVKVRSKQSLADRLPNFIFNEFWTDFDEKQSEEYKYAIAESRKDLRRVLESGNPLRFYANIFTLFHKLNQIGNFATDKSVSPKSELLLQHLTSIKKNKKKALIISQYEKQGTKKIADLLSLNDIKYVIAPNSLSVEEMKKSVAYFQSDNEMVAFITDAKISKSKFSNFDVAYIIKFDQWWNPISNWELEDLFVKEEGNQKEIINLYNYYVTGTLDEKIRELLEANDLLNKNVFELMQTKMYEELITVDEWLKVFGMPVNDEVKVENAPEKILVNLQKITIDNFRKILVRLLTVIGFSSVDILELAKSNSFKIIGKSKRHGQEYLLNAHVFEDRKTEKKSIENILSQCKTSNKNKIFMITRDKFPEISSEKMRENVIMLDGMALSKLLLRAGILPS